MNKKKYLIIYHKEDNDGVFSMAIIYNYIINELEEKPDIDLLGVDYNDLKEYNDMSYFTNKYTNIIMTDISFPEADKMIELDNNSSFYWFDHHAPIINDSIRNHWDSVNGLRDTSHSAIYNVYKYFYDPFTEHPIELFNVLSAWDSFSYEREGYTLDYVRNVNVGTNAKYMLNPDIILDVVYNLLYTETENDIAINLVYELGKTINDNKDAEYASLIKMNGDFTWTVDNRNACALFMQGPTNSLIFKTVPEDVKNGIIFKRNQNSNWTLSLYNTKTEYDNEFDCGSYLRQNYGGGGHKGAAGCQITESQFIELLKVKQI